MQSKRWHQFECLIPVIFLVTGLFVLFLVPGEEYFFGDSIAVLWNRPHSWDSLLRDFVRLDGALWFRPLSNSLPPFLLWPLFRMQFFPYHVVALTLHAIVAVALLEIFRRMFQDYAAACVAAAFFAFHPIQFYATYDIAFYQEPMMAGFALAALVLLRQYVFKGGFRPLVVGLLCFVLALYSKETAVVLPGALSILLWDRLRGSSRRTVVALAATVTISAIYTLLYSNVIGAAFRYQPDYRPQLDFQILRNVQLGLRWAFGLPGGWQTQGWQFPGALHIILWLVLLATVVVALVFPTSGLWRGLLWFLGSAFPAFVTHHLLPHHLYFPLIGVSFMVGGIVAWSRPKHFWRLRGTHILSPASAAVLTALFLVAYLAARADAVSSWVGHSAWEVQNVTKFARAAGLHLDRARGVLIYIRDDRDLSFDLMGGDIFTLLGRDDLEIRMTREFQAETAPGFYVLEYRNGWMSDVTPPESQIGSQVAQIRMLGYEQPVEFRFDPPRVRPGAESYCVRSPRLARQKIDVKYQFNQRTPRVAYNFAQLDELGNACFSVPISIPWGTVDVLAVRPTGLGFWRPTKARITLSPPRARGEAPRRP